MRERRMRERRMWERRMRGAAEYRGGGEKERETSRGRAEDWKGEQRMRGMTEGVGRCVRGCTRRGASMYCLP